MDLRQVDGPKVGLIYRQWCVTRELYQSHYYFHAVIIDLFELGNQNLFWFPWQYPLACLIV